MERENNNTALAVIITILVVVILGLVGFIVCDKIINNNSVNDNNTTDGIKNLGINDSKVTALIYPSHNRSLRWEYKNVTISSLGRLNMMRSAVVGVQAIPGGNSSVEYYSAIEIEKNFKRIFGPDTSYQNVDITGGDTCEISKYNSSRNAYEAIIGCGGDSLSSIKNITKMYKAEQDGDYIYTYFYVQPVLYGADSTYLFDRESDIQYSNNKVVGYTKELSSSNVDSTVETMMDNGDVDTYKWTFKKQSDGKYYFFSGNWEEK